MVTNQLSKKISDNYMPFNQFEIPKGYILADPLFNIPKPVELLIGTKSFYTLLLHGII